MDHAFKKLGQPRVISLIRLENKASRRVACKTLTLAQMDQKSFHASTSTKPPITVAQIP